MELVVLFIIVALLFFGPRKGGRLPSKIAIGARRAVLAVVPGRDGIREPASLGYAQPSFWNRIAEQLSPPSEEEINRNMYDLDVHIEYEARRRKDGEPMQEVDFAAKTFVSQPVSQ